jgi:hypothetical protein
VFSGACHDTINAVSAEMTEMSVGAPGLCITGAAPAVPGANATSVDTSTAQSSAPKRFRRMIHRLPPEPDPPPSDPWF